MRYELCEGEVLTLEASGAIESVTVTAGRIWLTRSGDTRDYCLASGERLEVVAGEKLVLEALAHASLTITCRESGAGARISMALSNPCPAGMPL